MEYEMGWLRPSISHWLSGGADGRALIPAAPPVSVRQIFHRFWPYARSYRRWLALTLVFVALAPAIETLTIWLFKLLVDEVLVPRNFGLFL
jgi:ATP-binding cassette, subfamily B, bacterial